MGTTAGAQRRWAKQFGLSLDEYLNFVERGLKRCQVCERWKEHTSFHRDRSRKDRLAVVCRECKAPTERKIPVLPEWAKEKLRQRNRTHRWRRGLRLPEHQKKNLRRIAIEQGRFVGTKSPTWKGGITPKDVLDRRTSKGREWRLAVLERDNFTCRRCGAAQPNLLCAHHIVPWSKDKSLRYNINNGLALCGYCHKAAHFKPDSIRNLRKARKAGSP